MAPPAQALQLRFANPEDWDSEDWDVDPAMRSSFWSGGDYIRNCRPYTIADSLIANVNWVIGDIHGMFGPLDALLAAVSRRDPAAHFVFVGDYANRGADSRRVIDLLVTVPNATFLRGNHDDVLDLLLNGDCYICHPTAPERLVAFKWFMQHGLAETLISYGADPAELESVAHAPSLGGLDRCLTVVPEAHRAFFRSLKPVFEAEHFFVAHGYWDPDDADHSPSISNRLGVDPELRLRQRIQNSIFG